MFLKASWSCRIVKIALKTNGFLRFFKSSVVSTKWLPVGSSWPQVGSSWGQVGLKLPLSWAQVGPRWPVDSKWRQKPIPENMSKNITFRIASNSIFDRFWLPRWAPGEGQNFHFWGLKTVLEPIWPPGSSRGPPGCPHDRLREPRRPIWATFSSILERFLSQHEANLRPTWSQHGAKLGASMRPSSRQKLKNERSKMRSKNWSSMCSYM